jgi:hypothetical protein
MKYNTLKALQNAVLETLESRQMMSAAPIGSVSIDKGIVTLTGDPQLPTMLDVSYAPNGNLLANAGQTFREYPVAQVKEFVINGGAGADYIYIDPNIDIPANINSGQGNDTIRAGGGNDTVVAGNGNVLIYGKTGNNIITVGNGNDTILSGGSDSSDTVHAGNGNDSIVGGGGNNLLVAGDGDDTMIGGGGNDTIVVGNGNDLLRGSLGNDSLKAGTGHDILEGDSGNDTLVGGGAGSTDNPGPGSNTVAAPNDSATCRGPHTTHGPDDSAACHRPHWRLIRQHHDPKQPKPVPQQCAGPQSGSAIARRRSSNRLGRQCERIEFAVELRHGPDLKI